MMTTFSDLNIADTIQKAHTVLHVGVDPVTLMSEFDVRSIQLSLDVKVTSGWSIKLSDMQDISME